MENKLHSMNSRCNDMELNLNDSLSKLEGTMNIKSFVILFKKFMIAIGSSRDIVIKIFI